MESQDSIPDDFLKRFVLQGKIISQLITFWWRYSDNKGTADDQKKINIADDLGKILLPGIPKPNPGRRLTVDRSSSNPPLIDLFNADPRLHINDENPDKYVDMLITIFGRDRISNKETYLSPIFNSTELGLNKEKNFAYYEFSIDRNGTRLGQLSDPEIVIGNENSLLKYQYKIPLPPRPARIDNELYETWISNENDMFPPDQLIPFTT